MSGRPPLARRASAEALGTFALVFAGCGAIVTNTERAGALGVVGVSLVSGLVILAAIAAFGQISGAHFNPAVTTSFFLTRHLPGRDAMNPARSFVPALISGQWHDFWVYLAGPLLGAPLGAFAYQFVRGEHPRAPGPAPVPEES